MNIPEIFRYNTLISVPLFTLIGMLLVVKLPGFAYSQTTFSRSILFLHSPLKRLVFRVNFIIKALLDLGFVWYVAAALKLSLTSPLTILWTLSAVLFSSLSIFLEGSQTIRHRVMVYGSGLLWVIGQIYLANYLGQADFIKITLLIAVTTMVMTFGSLFFNKTNVLIQIACVALFYAWIVRLVFEYL
jgi:hypothetical protein